ncbi:zinc finger protein 569-like [Chrysoperla carnea]|uniref:zinc finger protein 569-like n=1 Tax=Chrysoperla carnea TaxID=189513 RepID=UPI001D08B561|nr:zinc finger protein 569-like [Chrysoperla carnea]
MSKLDLEQTLQRQTMSSFKLKCRICLIDQNQNQLLSLFSKNEHFDDAALTNADLIMACSSVHIDIKDGFPQHLCLTCYEKLSELYEFKQLCESSDKVLHDSIQIEEPESISIDVNVKYEVAHLELESVSEHLHQDDDDEDDADDAITPTALDGSEDETETENDIKMEYNCTTCPQRFNDENDYFNHLDNCPPLALSKPELQKVKTKRKEIKNDLKGEIVQEGDVQEDAIRINKQNDMNCKICNVNVLNMRAHIKLKHSKTACLTCCTLFKTNEQLQEHQKVTQHNNNNNDNNNGGRGGNSNNKQQCPLCNEYFYNLLRHHAKVHKTNKCPICDKSFLIYRYFIKHVKRHSVQSMLQQQQQVQVQSGNGNDVHIVQSDVDTTIKNLCPYCGRAFKELGNLKQHIRIHTGEKPYECEFCPKKFAQWSSLRSHRVVHTGEKNYACEICGKAFSRLVTLNKHLTSHSDERKYPCEICGRKFKHSRSVKEHMVIHTGIKSHKCTYCDKAFGFKKNLVVHLRTHTGIKPYQCELCKQAFTQRHCLRAHMKSHHKQQL